MTDGPQMSPRQRRMWIYRIAGPGGALALAALTLLLFHGAARAQPIDAARVTGALVMAVVIMAWSVFFAWLTARQEDEYTLAGAKYAWFWGGTIGLACSVPVLAFIVWDGVRLIDPASRPHPGAALPMVFGYMLAVVFQLVGFLAARVWWGMRRP